MCPSRKTFKIGQEKETVVCKHKQGHEGMHAGNSRLVKQEVYWDQHRKEKRSLKPAV